MMFGPYEASLLVCVCLGVLAASRKIHFIGNSSVAASPAVTPVNLTGSIQLLGIQNSPYAVTKLTNHFSSHPSQVSLGIMLHELWDFPGLLLDDLMRAYLCNTLSRIVLGPTFPKKPYWHEVPSAILEQQSLEDYVTDLAVAMIHNSHLDRDFVVSCAVMLVFTPRDMLQERISAVASGLGYNETYAPMMGAFIATVMHLPKDLLLDIAFATAIASRISTRLSDEANSQMSTLSENNIGVFEQMLEFETLISFVLALRIDCRIHNSRNDLTTADNIHDAAVRDALALGDRDLSPMLVAQRFHHMVHDLEFALSARSWIMYQHILSEEGAGLYKVPISKIPSFVGEANSTNDFQNMQADFVHAVRVMQSASLASYASFHRFYGYFSSLAHVLYDNTRVSSMAECNVGGLSVLGPYQYTATARCLNTWSDGYSTEDIWAMSIETASHFPGMPRMLAYVALCELFKMFWKPNQSLIFAAMRSGRRTMDRIDMFVSVLCEPRDSDIVTAATHAHLMNGGEAQVTQLEALRIMLLAYAASEAVESSPMQLQSFLGSIGIVVESQQTEVIAAVPTLEEAFLQLLAATYPISN